METPSPNRPAAATPLVNAPPSQAEEARPTMLIVDDSIDVHRLLKARLKNEDLDFLSAMSGQEGLALAVSRRPSIIILDLDMPGMDGLTVLRRLKETHEAQDIPVVVLSGLQASEDKVRAFELGAVDFVTKPFDMTELRVRVHSALKMRRLIRLLAQRAQVDGLTGLWNRAFFDRRWSEEHARSVRHSHPLSVALMDLDHFKRVNDTFGHPAGDSVLQGISKILLRESRQCDLACRYGGEEFVLLMSDTAAAAAVVVCERIRKSVEAAVWPAHPELRCTISIGVAGSSGATTMSAEAWLAAADRNLYAAKKSGRNYLVMSDVSAQAPRLSRAAG